MPSMTADDDHPFDPRHFLHRHGHRRPDLLAAAGRTAQRQPARLRRGPQAARITAPHPVDVPHGLDSPVGRVYELDGQVLLLGVDHTANTTIHSGSMSARYRRKKYVTLLKGPLIPVRYTEIDPAARTSLVDGWLESEGLQRRGPVGRAEGEAGPIERCDPGGHGKIQQNETVFLHPFGVDEECDDARLSLSEE